MSTLQFGQSCKRIKNAVVRNDSPKTGGGASGTPTAGSAADAGRRSAKQAAELARY